MKPLVLRTGVLCALFVLSIVPAAAELQFEGWGPRVGIADDPDQGIVGVHFDLSDRMRRLLFRPSVELGFGDDVDTLMGNALLAYRFDTRSDVDPYAGGQIVAALFDPDKGDEDTEIGIAAVGGIEFATRGGYRFHVELQLGFGDIHDVKLMGGWTF